MRSTKASPRGTTSDRQSEIVLRNVTKRFAGTTAVEDLTLELMRGTTTALLGPNGAGKSTVLNMLAGVLRPSVGRILWRNRSIHDTENRWRRSIGVVLEDLCLFDYLTFRENIVFAGMLYGLSGQECGKRADELLEYLSLGEHHDVPSVAGSSGMKKKLALALALVHSPEILLLDEVFSGIDVLSIHDMLDLLTRLARAGLTVLIASHQLDTLQHLIDRAVILIDGKVAADVSVSELKRSGRDVESVFLETVADCRGLRSDLEWLP